MTHLYSPARSMGKLMAGLLTISLPALLSAQVSLYQFSESVGSYTPITAADGGVALGTPVYWPHVNNNRAWVNNPFNDPGGQVTMSGYLNPAEGPGYPIGFDFTYNGDVFDRIGISNGGWISFGKSTDGLFAVWVYNWSGTIQGDPFIQWYNGPAQDYKRNRVAGFGNSSLQQVDWSSLTPPGQVSKVRMATIGTAPNRVCVIQWEDYGLRGDVTVAMNVINFQIRLNEIDNSVEVVFGPMNWVSSLGRYTRTQSGLSGRSNADFNGRMTVYEQPSFIYDWNNTVAADTMVAACEFAIEQPGMPNGSGIPPVEGLTWRWDPPVCPPPTWPQSITDISFDAAYASWQPAPAGQYEYLITTTNDPDGPVVTTDLTSDEGVFLFGLEPMTQYYFFIRSICDGEPGPWSMGTPFRTIGGGMVNCDGTAIDVTYCSQQNDSVTWQYISGDGSPLSIELLDGFHGSVSGEIFQVWNGAPGTGSLLYNAPGGANVGGLTFTASSGQITIVMVTGAGACSAQSWYLPYVWRVGCKNCQDPLVNFTVEEDCANFQYYVNANVFNLGSSGSLILNNSLGVPADTVSTTGNHLVGPFPSGQSVTVVAQNPDNVMCHADSPVLIGQPCAIQDCGPATYTYCYADNEQSQWAYQGENDQEIGIRFIRGTVGLGDHLRSYNGLDIDDIVPVDNTGSLANKLITSGAPSTDHAVVLVLQADDAVSCANEDPLFGSAEEWEYVVACYDGCVQPRATFSTACVSTTQYEVVVNLTEVGSTGSVQITNNGGAATVTATAAGTYNVGPFNAGTPVTVEVEGASILCTWTSPALVKQDCSDYNIGIAENNMGTLQLFPNPNTGRFTIDLPSDLRGTASLRVMDLAGRIVARQELNGTGMTVVQLPELPNGLYALALESNRKVLNGTIIIQR
ncbi:MAG: T9SS type A sorting domain-containing protein [Flavobacteriales bacterium]|nr:T9SS type A sorting domain-containing protein [Flavobacteriales bacterium]